MATFEDIKLIFQTHTNFENLRRDMRANAQGYLDALTAGTAAGTVATVMNENTARYQTRLGWALAAWNDLAIRAKLQSGLAALSLQQAELTGFYTELKAAADAEQAAPKSNAPQIQAAATATLANVAAHTSIWPNG
jgi:hypothetical protein